MTIKTQTQLDASAETEPSTLGPGMQLRQAREQENLTKSDVAGRLHLRVCIIEAIEADDYTNTPELVFVRGYLRSYANLLGIQPDNIIAAFNALNVQESRPERVLRQARKTAINKELPLGWISLLIIAGLILLVALWWHSQQKLTPLVSPPVINKPVPPHKTEVKQQYKSSVTKIPTSLFPINTSQSIPTKEKSVVR